ncbi:MAG: sigma-70 family RNA polymerase sigma factor [Eubacterium sp.]|nr:sigma-70 family RNA polymerase sigma factor [Eubacterium sp.]
MMNYNSFTEAVNAARAGEQDAFSWLYEKTSREKYYIAIKYMKNQTDAADVLQDAYMKAWQKLGSLDDPEKFPGWVGQIVANEALMALRKKNPLTFSDISGENDEGEEFVYDIEDESIERQPELNYTTNERQEIIRSMIDSLSDEQRMCVMMFYIEEMSVKEIAETLGVSENTVKSRLNYGRKNIKNEAEELKKKGYNFYSIAPLPLLLLLLRAEKASAMEVATAAQAAAATTAGTVASTATGTTQAAGSVAGASASTQAVGSATGTVGATTAAGTTSAAGMASATTAAASVGFFSTIAGKIVVTAAVISACAGLGFGGYQVYKAVDTANKAQQITEAVSGPAAGAEQTEKNKIAETDEKNQEPEPSEEPEEANITWENTLKMPKGYGTGNSFMWRCKGGEKEGYYYSKDHKLIYKDETGKKHTLTKIPCHQEKDAPKPRVDIECCYGNYVYINVKQAADGDGWGNGCVIYAYDILNDTLDKISDERSLIITAYENYMVIEDGECERTEACTIDCSLFKVDGTNLTKIKHLGLLFEPGFYNGRLYYDVYKNWSMKQVSVYSCNPDGTDDEFLFKRKFSGDAEYGQIMADLYDLEKHNGLITVSDGFTYQIKD